MTDDELDALPVGRTAAWQFVEVPLCWAKTSATTYSLMLGTSTFGSVHRAKDTTWHGGVYDAATGVQHMTASTASGAMRSAVKCLLSKLLSISPEFKQALDAADSKEGA